MLFVITTCRYILLRRNLAVWRDQILHLPIYKSSFCSCGGVLDFYQGDKDSFYGVDMDRFTYELSDHLPLWIQVKTDVSLKISFI